MYSHKRWVNKNIRDCYVIATMKKKIKSVDFRGVCYFLTTHHFDCIVKQNLLLFLCLKFILKNIILLHTISKSFKIALRVKFTPVP